MITTQIGRVFLDAYNKRFGKDMDARTFIVEKYFPLFFDSPKYMLWVSNSPFVQMKKGQKVETLTVQERREKLEDLIRKVENEGACDASVAIGYPASEEKSFATTSGQVTSMALKYTPEDVYLSWIGASLGTCVQGGYIILFNHPGILLDIYSGWEHYRHALNDNLPMRGNQVQTWNAQWLTHLYSDRYNSAMPMAGFDSYATKNGQMEVVTQSWIRLLFAISQAYPNLSILGYVWAFSQTNTTIGFIPCVLGEFRSMKDWYRRIFGDQEWRKAEVLYQTDFGFAAACQMGSLGLKALEPKGLKKYMDEGKFPKLDGQEEVIITFHIYLIWLIAMLNNEELWEKSREFAKELLAYAESSSRGKTDKSNKVNEVLASTSKKDFIAGLGKIASDADGAEKIEEMAKTVHLLPLDLVSYFLVLIRFQYAVINNIKNK